MILLIKSPRHVAKFALIICSLTKICSRCAIIISYIFPPLWYVSHFFLSNRNIITTFALCSSFPYKGKDLAVVNILLNIYFKFPYLNNWILPSNLRGNFLQFACYQETIFFIMFLYKWPPYFRRQLSHLVCGLLIPWFLHFCQAKSAIQLKQLHKRPVWSHCRRVD